jgi:hypothetical protein
MINPNINYKHIVLFKIKNEVSNEDFKKALSLLQNLGQDNSDIISWIVTPSLDTRKGRIIIEDSLFKNEETFQKFRSSEKHNEVAAFLRNIADWFVGDYLSNN